MVKFVVEGELEVLARVRNVELNSVGFFLRITHTAQVLMTTPSVRLGHFLNNVAINSDIEVFFIPSVDEVNGEDDNSVVMLRELGVSLSSSSLFTESAETTEEGVFTALGSLDVVGVTGDSPTDSSIKVKLVEFGRDEGLTFFNVGGDGDIS